MATVFTNKLVPFNRNLPALDAYAFVRIRGNGGKDFINAAVNETVLAHAVAVLYSEYPEPGEKRSVLVMCRAGDANLLTTSLNGGKDASVLSASVVCRNDLSQKEFSGILINSVAKTANASNALGHVMIRVRDVPGIEEDEVVFLDIHVDGNMALSVNVATFTEWNAFSDGEKNRYASLPKYGLEADAPVRLREGMRAEKSYIRKKPRKRRRRKNRVSAYRFGKEQLENKIAFLTRLENALFKNYPGIAKDTIFASMETNRREILSDLKSNSAKRAEYERAFFEKSAQLVANARFNFVFVPDGETDGKALIAQMRDGITDAVREFVPEASPEFVLSSAPVAGALNIVLIPYGKEHYKDGDDPHSIHEECVCQHFIYNGEFWKDSLFRILTNELVVKREILERRLLRFDACPEGLELYARFLAPRKNRREEPKIFVGGFTFGKDREFTLSVEDFGDFVLREPFCGMDDSDLASFECIAVMGKNVNIIRTTGIVGIPSREARLFILEENLKRRNGEKTKRGEGVRGMYGNDLRDALCHIDAHSGEDGHFYAVSNVGFSDGGLRENYENFQKVFCRVKPVFGSGAFVLEDWFMRLFEPNWIRAAMEPTVWPFPMKHIREYMKIKAPFLFEEEDGEEDAPPPVKKKKGKETDPRWLSLF